MTQTPFDQVKSFIIDHLMDGDDCREDWDLSELRETLELDYLALSLLFSEVLDSLIEAGLIIREVWGPEHDPAEYFFLVDDK